MKPLDNDGIELCEYQAQIFEESVSKLKCSSPVFIRRYFRSDFARRMDRGLTILFDFGVDEAFKDIERQFGPSSYGRIKLSPDAMNWYGWITRYICYTRGCSSSWLYREFPPAAFLNGYSGYHTQNEEQVIASILRKRDLKGSFLDPVERLKDIIRNRMNLERREKIEKYTRNTPQ